MMDWRRCGDQPGSSGAKPSGLRVLGALMLAIGVLLLAEGALRALYPPPASPPFQADARRGWRVRPNQRDTVYTMPAGTTLLSTNDLGLREIDVPYEKRPGEFRILCLGDSWTFGVGIAVEKTFVKRLQAHLRQNYPQRPITVINAGAPGYNWFQAYHSVDEFLERYHPDLVLICGFNEFSNLRIPAMERGLREDCWSTHLKLALRESRLYTVLRRGVAGLQTSGAAVQPGVYLEEKADRTSSQEAIQRYRRAVALKCMTSGARVLTFDHAFLQGPQAPDDYIWRPAPELPEGVVSVQLCPIPPGLRAPMFEWDPGHPDASGHERMAVALTRVLGAFYADQLSGAPADAKRAGPAPAGPALRGRDQGSIRRAGDPGPAPRACGASRPGSGSASGESSPR